MTQTEDKKNSKDLEPHDLKAEETLEELAGEEFIGVHIIGEEDTEKHFGRSDQKDSDNRGEREN